MLTTEQKDAIREKYASGYLVSDSKGIGFIEALEQAGESQHVYERLGKHTAVSLDHNGRMLVMLATMTALTRLKYGNLDAEVYTAIKRAEALVEEVTAYNAAQLAVIERYFTC